MRLTIPLLVLALLLAGCATTDALKGDVAQAKADLAGLKAKNEQALADLNAFTVADAQKALVIAQAAGILPITTCLPAVIKVLQAHQAARAIPPTGPPGAIELVVHVYLMQHPPIVGNGDALKVACAEWALQMGKDILKFEAAIASLVASGGVSGVSSVPDALAAAPKVLQLLRSLGAGGP